MKSLVSTLLLHTCSVSSPLLSRAISFKVQVESLDWQLVGIIYMKTRTSVDDESLRGKVYFVVRSEIAERWRFVGEAVTLPAICTLTHPR
jgi:hypothetical protein